MHRDLNVKTVGVYPSHQSFQNPLNRSGSSAPNDGSHNDGGSALSASDSYRDLLRLSDL
jgi:hypothetical protein